MDDARKVTKMLRIDGPVMLAMVIDIQSSTYQIPTKISLTGRKILRVCIIHVIYNVVSISIPFIACTVVVNTARR